MSGVTIPGWHGRYKGILRKFGYSRAGDEESARMLDGIIVSSAVRELQNMIYKRPVFVIGAGPSIYRAPPIIKRHKAVTIAADSATGFLLQNRICPDIVVTDLDGGMEWLCKAAKNAIMVVHAHGHNRNAIHMASGFPKCVGTTQSRPAGKIQNFGGFTDGDRAVFLAEHFCASVIILLGMDMGKRIGRQSGTASADRHEKLAKLEEAQSLIKWLAARSGSPIYSATSCPGITKITPDAIGRTIAMHT